MFNTEMIPRTINFSENGSQITLEDYILSQPDGTEKEFHTCSDVLAFPEAKVIVTCRYGARIPSNTNAKNW